MNRYKVTVYFSDKVNIETNIKSSLDINAFTNEMSMNFNRQNITFINYIGDDTKYCINKNNVLFFIVEKEEE